ncbi:ATP-dependent RNA helicase drs1 [Smittium mucronatum]|uniref:RNA helicase n=1 Tax=Smittium mucronatum TaxID=133383 RepID=A0A1R0GZ05_9FUNG|nr:ATP-dependent RNA helicase drs1 [Smittium mucronatum]
MAKNSDFVMTINDDDAVETYEDTVAPPIKSKKGKKSKPNLDLNTENVTEPEIDPSFNIDLEVDALDIVPQSMDFSLARASLAGRSTNSKKRTVDDFIAQKRRENKKVKAASKNDAEDSMNKPILDTEPSSESADHISPAKDETQVNENINQDKLSAEKDNSVNNDNSNSDSGSSSDSDDYSDSDDNEPHLSTTDLDLNTRLKTKVKKNLNDNDSDSDSESEIDQEEEARKKEFFSQDDELEDLVDDKSDEPVSFTNMNLSRPIMKGLSSLGFVAPTPIQAKTIPIGLMGKDICGSAVTGSGKTVAFLVPILERLLFRPTKVPLTRVLILAPTRELAMQCHNVAVKLCAFTDIRTSLIVGGLSIKVQESELRERPDIVIATPGRLIDHARNSASFTLDHIEILIMDEADRMLEDGFKEELTEIVNYCPKNRQTMLFSATMTDNINDLIRMSLNRPVRLMVDPPKQTSSRLVQEFVRVRMGKEDMRPTFLTVLCKLYFRNKCIIFFRSKIAAHQFKILFGLLGMKAGELHGSMNQENRMQALESFRDGKVDFLMATDLASRGLDIKGVQTVINYNMPQTFSLYLHRVGRTARAGRSGRAVTLVGENDRKMLKEAIKSANKSEKSSVKQRVLDNNIVIKYKKKIDLLNVQVEEIMKMEKEEAKLEQVEMEVNKAENMIKFEKDIYSRPKRTWFMSEKQKMDVKKVADKEYMDKIGI